MAISDAERQRRSEQAKRQWREGSLKPAHQRKAAQRAVEAKSDRASQIAQDLLAQHRDRVEAALLAGLRSKSDATRVKAAETIVRMAQAGQRQETTEAVAQVNVASTMTRDQLLRTLSEKLTSGPTAALMRSRIEGADVIDGTVIEG